ncbi:MAG: hypothetical protein ACRC62_37505 [Microcoleus sp.]
MPSLRVKRGTKAQIDTAAAANGLKQGEPYLVTDTARLAMGMGLNSYKEFLPSDQIPPTVFWDAVTDCWAATQGGLAPFGAAGVSSGTVATANPAIPHPDHPGIVKLRCSTIAGSGYRIFLESIRLKGNEASRAWINFNTITNTTIRFGFHDCATQADAVDGVYFEMVGGATTINAVGKIANNSVRTSSIASPNLGLGAQDWYRFDIEHTGLTSARFRIFDINLVNVFDQTVTATIPSGINRETGAGIIATNSTLTTATDLCHVDFLAHKISTLNR